jgi:hypothetical protein
MSSVAFRDRTGKRGWSRAGSFHAGGRALEIQIVGKSDDHLDFNVTRCGYAELYRNMGLAEIGYRILLQPRFCDDRRL